MLGRILPLAVLLLAPAARAQSLPVDDPDALAEAAVAAHPSLEALRWQAGAFRASEESAQLWADPVVAGELSNLPVLTPWLGNHAMSGLQLKVQQRFPAPGEPAARAALADASTEAALDEVDAAANALRGEVRAGYWQLALVRQLRDVTSAHVRELDGLLEAVQARYEVGVASQHDLLQLQLRRDRLAEDLADFDAREAALLAALNGALARDPATAVGTPKVSDVGALPLDPEARTATLQGHPAIVAVRARGDVERSAAARARIEARPEPTAWLGYRVRAPTAGGDAGDNFVTAGVSVPLPIAASRRGWADEQAALSRARASDEMADGLLQRLQATLAAAEARYERAAAGAVAYRDQLGPSARATLESTLSAYRVDRAPFADLIRAEIALLDVERSRLLAETEAAAARAEIETLVRAADRPSETAP